MDALQRIEPAEYRGQIGVYACGEAWMYATSQHGTHAAALWGTPEARDVGELISFFRHTVQHIERHDIIVDVRDLESVMGTAFDALREYFATDAAALSRIVSRAAVLHKSTLVGAIAAGFFRVVPPPFPVSWATDPETAIGALGFPADAWHTFETARGEVMRSDGFRNALATAVAIHLTDPTLATIARRLALSPRSLQRKLQALGTTLARETRRVRVERAKTLLATEASVTTIAYDLGFSSPEHFGTTFREETGLTPTAWRKR